MAGYTRTDTTNNIATGNVINASDLDNEYDAIQAAHNATTGHTHGGAAGEGAPITRVGPVQDVVVSGSAVTPKTDNTMDLGSAALEFKDLYIDGTANIDSLVADTADINGGTVDGAVIGGASAAAGTFTTVNATTVNTTNLDLTNLEVTNIKAKDGTASATIADSTGVMTVASSVLTTTDINGGTIDGTAVGATTRSTGAFTTLASNGATTFTAGTASTSTTTGTAVITGGLGVSGRINAANFDGIVGANTAAAGNFTTLGASSTATLNTLASSGATLTGGSINGMAIGGTTAAAGKFTTLEATGVTTVQAGTVSAPALTTTGDTNTGIFFPAADTIAFTEGGVESMRINSSGNVGIGATPSTWSLGKSLEIGTVGNCLWGAASADLRLLAGSYFNSGFKYAVSSQAVAKYEISGGSHAWFSAPSGTAGNAVTFTQAMTLHASGGLSLGNTTDSGHPTLSVTGSPNGSVESIFTNTGSGNTASAGVRGIGNSTGNFGLRQYGTGVTATAFGQTLANYSLLYSDGASSNGLILGSITADPVIIGTNNAERMRIDSTGNLLVGTTTNTNSSLLVVNGTASETVSSTQYLVASQYDVGTAPNKIPLNQYLGTMAYQDSASVNITGGIVDVSAGTAALPSLGTTGDENTGVFFPAADTIAASTNGVERVRVDSAGNFGIGTSSPAARLDVLGQAMFQGSTVPNNKGALIGVVNINNNSSDGTVDFTQGLVFTDNASGGGAWTHAGICTTGSAGFNGNLIFGTDNDGAATTSITEKMRLSAVGFLGIGTTTPSAPLEAVGNSAVLSVKSANDGGSSFIAFKNTSGTTLWDTGLGTTVRQDEYTIRRAGSLVIYCSNTGGVGIGTATDAGAGRLRVNSSMSVGNATPSTSGAGLTFPATQSASSDANTLDDYEEGTWTPVLRGSTTAGTFVYTAQAGKYTKIGNTVIATFTIVVSSVSVAAAGPINIIDLPFISSSLSNYRAGGSIANIQGMQLNGTAPLLEVGVSSTTLVVYGFNNNAAFGASDSSTIGAGDFINGSITYQV